MEWTFELSETPELLRIVASGDFCSRQFGAMLDELVALPFWHRGIPLLFDLRQIRHTEIDSLELMATSEHVVQKNNEFAHTPIAVLMATPEDMEIGMRFGKITGKRSLAELRGFLGEREAVEWLSSYVPAIVAAFGLLFL
jgi:hypothetical protein